MSEIVEVIRNKKRLLYKNGVDESEIRKAEAALGLAFAEDYCEYLKVFKSIAYSGHEITGLINSKRTNVVEATLDGWNENPNIPHDMYLIEETGIDGISIWQKTDGKVYYVQFDKTPVYYCESFEEYVRKY